MFKIFDLLNGSRLTREYAEQCLTHGVEAILITINNYRGINPLPDLRQSLRELAAYRKHLATLHDVVHVIERFDDFQRAREQRKVGVLIGYQNVPGVERDLGILEIFHCAGVRCIQVAHNIRNLYADGCGEPQDGGLSTLGRELVATLNDLGIIMDLSHTGDRSGIEVMDASRHPVAVTHANSYTVCPNSRNRSDALLDRLKTNGGVIGVCYLPPIVTLPGSARPTPADVAKHVVHIAKRIGVEHVALGTDFITDQPPERYQEFMRRPDLYGTWPWRFPVESLAQQQEFLESLQPAGFSAAQVQEIARDNALRVFKAVLS